MRKNLSKKHQTYTSTPSPYFRRLTPPLTTSTSKKYVSQELLPRNTGPACEPLGQLDFKGVGTKTHYFSTFQKAQGTFVWNCHLTVLLVTPRLMITVLTQY
ncbi:hypothetical protein RhiirA5_356077, partial [Rhizophagus irregularis]